MSGLGIAAFVLCVLAAFGVFGFILSRCMRAAS
jgi:hypothetical protein